MGYRENMCVELQRFWKFWAGVFLQRCFFAKAVPSVTVKEGCLFVACIIIIIIIAFSNERQGLHSRRREIKVPTAF